MATKAIRAKFTCYVVEDTGYSEHVRLNPVYSSDPASENHAFWKATPNGTLELYIDNPDAKGAFEQGREYYIDIAPAGADVAGGQNVAASPAPESEPAPDQASTPPA